MSEFLILSRKWTRPGEPTITWWRPKSAGYTGLLDDAGRYTKEEAHAICVNSHGEHVAVPVGVAERFAKKVVLTHCLDRLAEANTAWWAEKAGVTS